MATTTQRIPVADLQAGMAIEFLGTAHTVSSVDARTPHPTVPQIDRTVVCTDGFTISAESAGSIEVLVAS